MTGGVAVIGAGLIGRSWAVVFARAGYPAALWDGVPGAAEAALPSIGEALAEDAEALRRVRIAATLQDAVRAAGHVQENVPERIELKREVLAAIDAAAPAEAVVASSTSYIPMSAMAADLPGRARCLVAHPANPPHLLPVVELVPAPFTDADAVERTAALMRAVGQVPVVIRREVRGFVMNRLQAALVNEAMALVRDGVVDPDGLDDVVRHSLGLRWSFMGPFETMDLNAPGGFADYAERYAASMEELAAAPATGGAWGEATVARVVVERRAALAVDRLAERGRWRDRRLARLVEERRCGERDLGA